MQAVQIPSKVNPLWIINNFCGFEKHFPQQFNDFVKSASLDEILTYVHQYETDHMLVRVEKPIGSGNIYTAYLPIKSVFSNHKRFAIIKNVLANSTICWNKISLNLHSSEYLHMILPSKVKKKMNFPFMMELVQKCVDIDKGFEVINVRKNKSEGFKRMDWFEHYGPPKLKRVHRYHPGCGCRNCNPPPLRFNDFEEVINYCGPSFDYLQRRELKKLGIKFP